MNKFLRSSGIVFSMLLLVSVSATAQVKKKAVVRKTTTARTVKVATCLASTSRARYIHV